MIHSHFTDGEAEASEATQCNPSDFQEAPWSILSGQLQTFVAQLQQLIHFFFSLMVFDTEKVSSPKH